MTFYGFFDRVSNLSIPTLVITTFIVILFAISSFHNIRALRIDCILKIDSCQSSEWLICLKHKEGCFTNWLNFGREPWSSGYGKRLTSESHGFEPRHHILGGHFFAYICCKNCNLCSKRPKINEKEAGVGPIKWNRKSMSFDSSKLGDWRRGATRTR